MDSDAIVSLARNSATLILLIGSPVLLVGLLVGLVVGLAQACTQIQDQTIPSVAKIVSMLAAFALFLPWCLSKLVEFSQNLLGNLSDFSTFLGV